MQEVIGSALVFTFLSNLNIDQTKTLVHKVYNNIQTRDDEQAPKQLLLEFCTQLTKKIAYTPVSLSDFIKEAQQNFNTEDLEINLQSWYEFVESSSVDERVTLLLSQYLRFSDTEIANALEVSVGTVRFRISESYYKMSRNMKYA